MKKFSTILLMAVAIAALIAILMMLCPWFTITSRPINGIENLDEDKVNSILDECSFNNNLLSFNIFKAKKELKKLSYVESVSFVRHFPSTLEVNISERKIRGYVPYLNNFLYIDDSGRVLDVKSSYTKPCPIVRGLHFSSFTLGEVIPAENSEAFAFVVDLSNMMTELDLTEDIVKVDVSDIDDIHLYVKNIDVIFGDRRDTVRKIGLLAEIIKEIPEDDKGFLYLNDLNSSPRFVYLN